MFSQLQLLTKMENQSRHSDRKLSKPLRMGALKLVTMRIRLPCNPKPNSNSSRIRLSSSSNNSKYEGVFIAAKNPVPKSHLDMCKVRHLGCEGKWSSAKLDEMKDGESSNPEEGGRGRWGWSSFLELGFLILSWSWRWPFFSLLVGIGAAFPKEGRPTRKEKEEANGITTRRVVGETQHHPQEGERRQHHTKKEREGMAARPNSGDWTCPSFWGVGVALASAWEEGTRPQPCPSPTFPCQSLAQPSLAVRFFFRSKKLSLKSLFRLAL